MPLIVMCGIPLSGKSYLTQKINNYFIEKDLKPIIITDEIKLNEYKRNNLYMNSNIEKQMRSWLKSQVERYLNSDNLVIMDAKNYIKGFRYELYCSSKERKTTHCVIECAINSDIAWNRNEEKCDSLDKYNRETFDALLLRYEAPDSRNRWDSPLFVINFNDEIPFDEIMASLYSRKAPKPNLSTQSQPLTSTNFLYELDCKTQQVIKLILNSTQSGQLRNIVIPNAKETINLNRSLSVAELSKLKRQFINYSKMHPISDNELIVSAFVQFINKSI